jgi:GT2 family glycosyltransferase
MARVQIQIVGWNHKRFLPRLFESLRTQTFKDMQIVYIDNASADKSVDLVRERFPEVMCLKNTNNLGFTGAHNQGFQLALSKCAVSDLPNSFVFVLNPDIVATPTLVEELVRAAERNPGAGVVGAKLMKMFATEGVDHELEQVDASEIIDSTGIVKYPSGRFADRGAGEIDNGQFAAGDVWGISGAAMFVRLSAIESVREGEAVFDVDFFAYKEDVDLNWRLRRAGWTALYAPSAVAYHYRGAYGKEKASLWEQLKNRRNKSPLVSYLSYRNHLLLLTKNMGYGEFIVNSWRIVPYEIGKFFAMLFLETGTLWKAFWSFVVLWPTMMKKRGKIRKITTV